MLLRKNKCENFLTQFSLNFSSSLSLRKDFLHYFFCKKQQDFLLVDPFEDPFVWKWRNFESFGFGTPDFSWFSTIFGVFPVLLKISLNFSLFPQFSNFSPIFLNFPQFLLNFHWISLTFQNKFQAFSLAFHVFL